MCIKPNGITQCPIHEHDLHFHGLVNQEGHICEKWECVACPYVEYRRHDGFQDTEWRR
jgi:hypothetical protein